MLKSLKDMFGRLLPSSPSPRVLQIGVTTLRSWLAALEPPLLVDVRAAAEYERGHIPGARLLPLAMLGQRAHELPQERMLVLICRTGARSQVACEQLSRLGFVRLANVRGGIVAWIAHGYPIAPEQATAEKEVLVGGTPS